MADINNLNDEQRLNDILSERDNIINDINESLEKTNDLANSVLNSEINITSNLEEEKTKRDEITEKVIEELINEDEILNKINDVNEVLKDEKDLRTEINDTIDGQKDKLNEVKDISENMSSAVTSALTSQITNTQTLEQNLSNIVTAFNNITSAATAASNATSQVGTGTTQPSQSGGTSNNNGGNNNNNNNSGGTNNSGNTLNIDDKAKGKNFKEDVLTALYEGLKNFTKQSFNKWVEIDDKVHKVGRTIGMTGAQARAMVEDVTNNYGNMAQRLGMTFEEIFKFQENYNKSIGRGTILANEQVEAMAGLSKLVGDTAVEEVVKNMDDLGASTDTATLYLTQNMARAKAHGLDAKKTSEAFANNIKLASKYTFREGVNGISKMTLLSQKLKFNMDSIANAAGRFETVQSAIETAANLQMLGGSYAAQFGNPLEAMNMAMLDMEGFTNKIVDTFKGKAVFNRETGQAEMSAIDKRLLKEAANQLGIGYEEAWNMATQSAKINDIERSLKPSQTFTEEQKALIANKSVFKDGQHQITFYGENNDKITKGVDQLTPEDLKFLTDETTTEVAMADDVHGIKLLLQDYLGKTVKDTKSTKEIYQGNKEQVEMAGANMVDNVLGYEWFKNLHDSLQGWGQTLVLGALSITGTFLNGKILKGIKNISSGGAGGSSGTNPPPGGGTNPPPGGGTNPPPGGGTNPPPGGGTPKPKSKIAKGGLGRTLNRFGLKTLGRTGLKTLGKRIPYIGTAIAAIGGVVDASNAISSYSQKKMEIEASNMSEKEKALAKTEAKRERNKGVGGAVGSTGGALGGAALGAAIGSFILPGVGTIIGGALGGWLGEKAGKEVGSAVGAAVTTEEKVENEKKEKELKDKEVKVNDNGVILAQIKDYNQLIYELLLNKYSSVTKETVTNLSSVDQSVIKEQRQHLAISSNKNDIHKEYAYGGTSNNFIESGVIAQGNALRNHNGKDYDLTDPKQRYEYQINQLLDRNITSGKQRESRNKQLELISKEAQELYGIEPYDYKADERYLAIQNSINNSHYANKANYVNNDNLHSSNKHNNAISRTNYVNNDNLYANNEHNKYNNAQTINGTDSFALTNNEKISQFINDFTQKATFNAETNTYEMSAIDKRIMKEAAKQLGVDNDGMWEMISQNINNNFENQTNAKYASYSNDSYNIDDSNNIMKPYNYSLLNNITPKDINYNNDITPKVTVGLQTPIRETSIRNQFSNSISDNNGKIDLNVSGSIKLTTDRGSSTEIDINKLLNNTEFMNNLVSIISENFNKRVNGQRHLKNAVSYLQNGGYGYNQFNSITNGWG